MYINKIIIRFITKYKKEIKNEIHIYYNFYIIFNHDIYDGNA